MLGGGWNSSSAHAGHVGNTQIRNASRRHTPRCVRSITQRTRGLGRDTTQGQFVIGWIMPLSSRMPELAAFEVLLAIANTGSLGAAARGSRVGLNKQCRRGWHRWRLQTGVRLALRSSRGSHLTPSGVLVAEGANRLLDVAHHVDMGLASLRTETRKRIRVEASQTVAEQFMPRWLVSLRAAATGHGGTAPR